MAYLWHCTVNERLIEILEAGEIRLASAFTSDTERKAAWFTFSDEWEETANKSWADRNGTITSLTREETHRLGGGLIRIAVEPTVAPYNWNSYVAISGVSPKIAQNLAKRARLVGSDTSLWRVSFEPVGRANWLTIERWDGSAWKTDRDAREVAGLST